MHGAGSRFCMTAIVDKGAIDAHIGVLVRVLETVYLGSGGI